MNNPSSKDIDIKSQAGLDLLKEKAKYYGHYAENLKILELIKEIEELRSSASKSIDELFHETSKKLGW